MVGNVIENQWSREKRRKLHGCARATMLTETSVVPNCHSKMAVGPAKNVFHIKTLNELTMNIAKRLGCFGNMMNDLPDPKKAMSYDVDQTSMRISTLYKSRVTFLKEMSMKKAHMTINVSDKLSKED